MRHINFKKLLGSLGGWLGAASMLFVSSCRDDTFSEYDDINSDETRVTFSITPEAASIATRSVNYPAEGDKGHISDGSKADILIYAVYRIKGEEGKDGYEEELLDSYGMGIDQKLQSNPNHNNLKCGGGQTVMAVSSYPYNLSLTFKKNYKYKVAFWTQDSRCNAYNTLDLRKVEVIYNEFKEEDKPTGADAADPSDPGQGDNNLREVKTRNNDESRDAFCRSVEVDLTNSTSSTIDRNVYLYRPLAQINVGTNGYDFEIVNRENPKKYRYSKIRINRVARYLNVVADKTYHTTTGNDPYGDRKTDEAFSVVDFDYAPLPAYTNMDEIPTLVSHTVYDWKHNPDYSVNREGVEVTRENYFGIYGNEEFLKVSLYDYDKTFTKNADGFVTDDEGNFSDSKGNRYVHMDEAGEFLSYASLNNHNDMMSETFKYLSMCYVLTSSTQEDPIVFNNVKVWLATSEDGENEYELLNLNNVPAQRNWRTNIVGNLMSVEKTFTIKLDQDFAGEYTSWKQNGEWAEWSGPLHNGVFYNAEEDVIEISSKEGLLWFQKMVNGNMLVRESRNENAIGKAYKYYDNNGSEKTFNYSGIAAPSDKTLRERILRATHQIYNQNYKEGEWPGNFHFTGTKDGKDYPAKVRLMADIDLSGEKWIPIGFEARFGEQGDFMLTEASDKEPSNRVFYGIFDGNGHTIFNLSTMEFSAKVHDDALQTPNYKYKNTNFGNPVASTSLGTFSRHPMDNPQWWARGFFGQVGGNAEIMNLNLNNVRITGYNCVGGIVGIAYGDEIKIKNCVVDGGYIEAAPMFRGDDKSASGNRSYARGVYAGGIVGYFNTGGGMVDDCMVRMVTIKAVRRTGGLIGSINQKELGNGSLDEGAWMLDKGQRASKPASISGNRLLNVNLIVSSFTTYGFVGKTNRNNLVAGTNDDLISKIGFGWNDGQFTPQSHTIVGGSEFPESQRSSDFPATVFHDNDDSGVTFSKFMTTFTGTTRSSEIGPSDLENIPMLSSWFTDKVTLTTNYYGAPSARKHITQSLYNIFSGEAEKSGYTGTGFNTAYRYTGANKGNTFYFPMEAPFVSDVSYIEGSGNVGMFVESVELVGFSASNGSGNVDDNKSVLTPTDVWGPNDCAMYIAARDRAQFLSDKNYYKKTTHVKNMVIRGKPYAYTGISMAPNKNMKGIILENVAVYDCYKTLALDDWSKISSRDIWPHNNDCGYDTFLLPENYGKDTQPTLEIKESDLRGYTVPGPIWSSINYTHTTFGQGSYFAQVYGDGGYDTNFEHARTYVVEAPTVFNHCYFKAPYVITLSSEKKTADHVISWNFKPSGNKGLTYATGATSTSNVEIDPTPWSGCTSIVIETDIQGNPVVCYYKKYYGADDPRNDEPGNLMHVGTILEK